MVNGRNPNNNKDDYARDTWLEEFIRTHYNHDGHPREGIVDGDDDCDPTLPDDNEDDEDYTFTRLQENHNDDNRRRNK